MCIIDPAKFSVALLPAIAGLEQAGLAPSSLFQVQRVAPQLGALDSLRDLASPSSVSAFQSDPALYRTVASLLHLPTEAGRALYGREIRDDRTLSFGTSACTLETSLTLAYQEKQWGIERMALDGIANHLPADSGGITFSISFLTHDGRWTDFRDRDAIAAEEVAAIRFEDDGTGYDSALLPLLWSSKVDNEDAIGEKGEGLKLVVAAAVRNHMDVELASVFRDENGATVSWRSRRFSCDTFRKLSDRHKRS